MLVIGKLLQVRKLYKQANLSTPHPVRKKHHGQRMSDAQRNVSSAEIKPKRAGLSRLSTPQDNTFNQLPMPEVSFSFSHEQRASDTAETAKIRQSVLHNYIDDFFPKAAPLPEPIVEELPLVNYHIDSPAEDEFITVQETNEKLIRAIALGESKVLLSK